MELKKAIAYFISAVPFLIIYLQEFMKDQFPPYHGEWSGLGNLMENFETMTTRIVGGIPAAIFILLGIITLLTPDPSSPKNFITLRFKKNMRIFLLFVLLFLLVWVYWIWISFF